ncbi:hypothetical protein ES707_21031 [subsurface metagenome]
MGFHWKDNIEIHPKRQYINRMLLTGKRTLREIAEKYGSYALARCKLEIGVQTPDFSTFHLSPTREL